MLPHYMFIVQPSVPILSKWRLHVTACTHVLTFRNAVIYVLKKTYCSS